ncbi:hypothetical protein Deba_3292 [Desulfarculus baarsii DSM 2075]|uniref:Uncharacterized protein n=1 Tax=Desulfarculus baarsii (strain ATCC 33931 / DSM 2075 / LMG 7858 / VKM B-1802 / 2st14) TaxID=644282 RepID=E1QM60_DESB2|nr:hypothetical protein Deba_3292 [Desulfarculus baarsii DSM 2075]
MKPWQKDLLLTMAAMAILSAAIWILKGLGAP